MIIVGAFHRHPALAAVAASGVIFGAVYMLWMYQRVMFGPLDNPANQKLEDLSRREVGVLAPILVMVVVMGVYPRPFLNLMEASVDATLLRAAPAVASAAREEPADVGASCEGLLDAVRACGVEEQEGETGAAQVGCGHAVGSGGAGTAAAGGAR
ncbi:MAG: hypothetical protein D6760_10435 [Deltaproteobacteria bacterium]|nr:MAG: hypothetical protein D6760_10435 [Deltaproteobacteria bacterium]